MQLLCSRKLYYVDTAKGNYSPYITRRMRIQVQRIRYYNVTVLAYYSTITTFLQYILYEINKKSKERDTHIK